MCYKSHIIHIDFKEIPREKQSGQHYLRIRVLRASCHEYVKERVTRFCDIYIKDVDNFLLIFGFPTVCA